GGRREGVWGRWCWCGEGECFQGCCGEKAAGEACARQGSSDKGGLGASCGEDGERRRSHVWRGGCRRSESRRSDARCDDCRRDECRSRDGNDGSKDHSNNAGGSGRGEETDRGKNCRSEEGGYGESRRGEVWVCWIQDHDHDGEARGAQGESDGESGDCEFGNRQGGAAEENGAREVFDGEERAHRGGDSGDRRGRD
ncbi:MAG TPA: hypothetical protein PLA13_08530, partial [Microbacteriaceae bacterium]|nr:hypothetical protein [Microbacteriaceae bacterium]